MFISMFQKIRTFLILKIFRYIERYLKKNKINLPLRKVVERFVRLQPLK